MRLDVQVNIPAITAEITKVVSRTIKTAVFTIKQKMLISFSGPKSGRIYRRGGRTHQASAPGEAPAIDTGFLANSILTEFPNQITGLVTVGAEYGQILEEILNRPFVRPAIQGTIDELNKGGVIASFR